MVSLATLELDGGVVYAVFRADQVLKATENSVRVNVRVRCQLDMRRQCNASRSQRPDVKIMHLLHSFRIPHIAGDYPGINFLWRA
jgi:hypothetical protein